MICAAAVTLPPWELGLSPPPPPPPPPLLLPPDEHRQLGYGRAPSPPPFWLDRGLPPFAPGAMPPVPGPVFSKAFNALLVLLVIGCAFLGINLRDAVQKMYASDIGTNNEVLTTGAGNAAWLASIQKSNGRRSGHHSSCGAAVVAPKPKGKGKKSKAPAADDEEAQELETFVAKPKKGKKGKARG